MNNDDGKFQDSRGANSMLLVLYVLEFPNFIVRLKSGTLL